MRAEMSTSLKVVNGAAVYGASLRRRAITWHSLDMRWRSSRSALLRGPAGTDGRAAGAGPPEASRSITSPLVTRPSLPEPATPETFTPFSAASLAAAGRDRKTVVEGKSVDVRVAFGVRPH